MIEKKVYPAFYMSVIGNRFLYADKENYYSFERERWDVSNIDDGHPTDKNITTEYLANTYGEVKSKEHAEFIVELGKNAGAEISTEYSKGSFFNFYTTHDGGLCLDFFDKDLAKDSGEKQITIPLPPELNVNTPGEDFEMTQIEKNNGDNLLFGGDDKCEDWPCVGSKVTWGEREIIGTVKCIDNGWSWILCPDGKYTQQGVKYLKPPKTEDEKLRDEVKAVISEAMKNPLGFLCNADDELTDYMFKSFNITKKPQ